MDNSLTLSYKYLGEKVVATETATSALYFEETTDTSLRQHRGHFGVLIESSNLQGQSVDLVGASASIFEKAKEHYFKSEGFGSPFDVLEDTNAKAEEHITHNFAGASFYLTFFVIWGDALLYVNLSHRHLVLRRIHEFFDFDQEPVGSLQLKDQDLIILCTEAFWQKILAPTMREHQGTSPEEISRIIEDEYVAERNSKTLTLPLQAHCTYVSIDPTPSEEEIIEIDIPQKDTYKQKRKSFSLTHFTLPIFKIPLLKKPQVTLKKEKINTNRKWLVLSVLGILLVIGVTATFLLNKQAMERQKIDDAVSAIEANLKKASQIASLNPQESLSLISKSSDLLGSVNGIRTEKFTEIQTEIQSKTSEITRNIYAITTQTAKAITLPDDIKDHFMHITTTGIVNETGATIINPSPLWGEPRAVESYLDNRYVLDTKNSNLWKYQGPIAPNDTPISYLKEPLDLTQAQDLTIDGSVYLLFPDSIQKLTVGKLDTFSLRGTYPPFSLKSRITTGVDSPTIFVSSGNYVLVFDKSGTYKHTKEIPQVENITDLIANEDGSIVYILSDGSWFALELTLAQP